MPFSILTQPALQSGQLCFTKSILHDVSDLDQTSKTMSQISHFLLQVVYVKCLVPRIKGWLICKRYFSPFWSPGSTKIQKPVGSSLMEVTLYFQDGALNTPKGQNPHMENGTKWRTHSINPFVRHQSIQWGQSPHFLTLLQGELSFHMNSGMDINVQATATSNLTVSKKNVLCYTPVSSFKMYNVCIKLWGSGVLMQCWAHTRNRILS